MLKNLSQKKKKNVFLTLPQINSNKENFSKNQKITKKDDFMVKNVD